MSTYEGYENSETFELLTQFLDNPETSKDFKLIAKENGILFLANYIEQLTRKLFQREIGLLRSKYLNKDKATEIIDIREFIALSLEEKLSLINFKQIAERFTLS